MSAGALAGLDISSELEDIFVNRDSEATYKGRIRICWCVVRVLYMYEGCGRRCRFESQSSCRKRLVIAGGSYDITRIDHRLTRLDLRVSCSLNLM